VRNRNPYVVKQLTQVSTKYAISLFYPKTASAKCAIVTDRQTDRWRYVNICRNSGHRCRIITGQKLWPFSAGI